MEAKICYEQDDYVFVESPKDYKSTSKFSPKIDSRKSSIKRTPSMQIIDILNVSYERAKTELQLANGNIDRAINHIISLDMKAEDIKELCKVAQISEEKAIYYYSSAEGDINVAKMMIKRSQGNPETDYDEEGEEDIDKYQCPCCLDKVSSYYTHNLSECGHILCQMCLRKWIETELSTSSHGNIRCPFTKSCTKCLTQKEIQLFTSSEEYRKLETRSLETLLSKDNAMYQCKTPNCSYIVIWSKDVRDDGPPIFNCPLCLVERCLACNISPYHYGKGCEEVIHQHQMKICQSSTSSSKQHEEEEKATMEYLQNSGIRVCKKCGSGVFKSDGCDKMMCRCGYKFCYSCGSENASCICTPSTHVFWNNNTHQPSYSFY